MRPENTKASATNPSNAAPRTVAVPSRDAAVNLARGQLNAVYSNDGDTVAAAAVQPQPAPAKGTPHPQADQWSQYHSAWQDYYQKYYQRYYGNQAHQVLQQQASKAAAQSTTAPARAAAIAQPAPAPAPVAKNGQDAAMFELRTKLRTNIEKSADKARKSRHFIPIAAALAVVLLFSILQYNRVLIANVQAYVSPGAIDPQNIIVDPTTDVTVSPEPKLIIPKINVNVPTVYGSANDHDSLMRAMEGGVVHFAVPGASSVPGQIGNTVLSGHSSNDMFDSGNYKFVFAQLNNLQQGDTIYVNYQSKRYTYTVTKKEEVMPDNVAALTYQTDKPVLTLITCTPLGTALRRLLVTAEQISPDPSAAPVAPEAATSGDGAMPGNSPTLFQRIFGG